MSDNVTVFRPPCVETWWTARGKTLSVAFSGSCPHCPAASPAAQDRQICSGDCTAATRDRLLAWWQIWRAGL